MKKSLFLMVALVVGMTLAGCSKEEKGNMEENKKTIKDLIVGVWRSGEYFVSFSEDGYNSAFFPIDGEERIDEGIYTFDGDTVLVEGSFYGNTTKYIVNSVSESSISLTVVYRFRNMTFEGDAVDSRATLTLTKSADMPSVRINGLEGKTFTIEDTYTNGRGRTYDYTQINTIHSSEKYQYIDYTFDFHGDKPEDFSHSIRYKFYVLLGQTLYCVTLSQLYPTDMYNTYARGLKVEAGTLSAREDGTLEYQRKR